MSTKVVPVNEYGRRIGDTHHKSRFTDEQINRIRDLREEFGLSYSQIAELFQCHKQTIASICQYRTRAQTPFGWKKLQEEETQ